MAWMGAETVQASCASQYVEESGKRRRCRYSPCFQGYQMQTLLAAKKAYDEDKGNGPIRLSDYRTRDDRSAGSRRRFHP